MLNKLSLTVLFISLAPLAWAQAGTALVHQSVRAQLGQGTIPSDVVLTGQITDDHGVIKPYRMIAKGKDTVRFESGDSITVYSAGAGWGQSAGKAQAFPPHAAIGRAEVIPFLDLLTEIDNPHTDISAAQSVTLAGRAVNRLTIKLKDNQAGHREFNRPLDEQTTFYIDSATSLILRSERTVTAIDNMDNRFPTSLDFSDYKNIQGYAIPFRIVKTLGAPQAPLARFTITVASVVLNSGIADSTFAIPSAAPPATVAPTAGGTR